MRRGRRPYPDILTPRQWEVLELLRLGLTDPEIAQRLGLSLDGAKYHVSEILSKLGVTSREEAASWQAEPAPRRTGLFSRGFLWAVLGGGIIGASVVGMVVLAVGVVQSGTGDSDGTQSESGAPLIGRDHWHAPYQVIICGERLPDAPTWEGVGVHAHGDGIIHIHPFTAAEEGLGARLTKWFEYGAGVLSEDEVRVPGFAATHRNGEECPDGTTGEVQVFANGEAVDLDTYIPQDGDRVKVVFGPPDDGEWEGEVPMVDPSGAVQ